MNDRKEPSNRRTAPREDCEYWQASFGVCGITGNDFCIKNCEDYVFDAYGVQEEEF